MINTSFLLQRYAIAFVVSYLLGSLNFGIIISKFIFHKDIRSFGSGNAGTTNMLRTFGKKAAVFTVIGDILKGTVSVLFAKKLFSAMLLNLTYDVGYFEFVKIGYYIAVAGALLGHLYPVYFNFKGGKGVTVAFGAMVAAEPIPVMICFAIFVAVVLSSKIVSLSSITAAAAYFVTTLVYFKIIGTFSWVQLAGATIFPAIIIYAHRTNIKRLLNGTEYKFGQKK